MQLGQQSNPHSAVFPFSSFGAETGRHFRSAQGKAQDQTRAEMWKEYEWQFLPLLYIQYDSLYLLGFARFGSVTNLTNLPILKKNGSPPHPPAFPCSGSSAGCRRRRGPLRGSFDRSRAPRGQGLRICHCRFELILASQCRVVYQTVTLSDFHEVHNDTHGVLTTRNVIHIPGFQPDLYSESKYILIRVKPVRCNPDVAPRLTSGGYEDKVDVITPINILFKGGGKFWPLMKIKLMLLPQSTYCS